MKSTARSTVYSYTINMGTAGRFAAFKTIKSLAKILLVCKHQQPGDKDDTNQSKYFTVYDDGGTLGFLVTDNNIQPQLVAGAVLRLALGKWGVHVHTPLLYRTSLAHSFILFIVFVCGSLQHSVLKTPRLEIRHRCIGVTITVPIRPIMN